jgi:flagellar biosynthesis protein FlhB
MPIIDFTSPMMEIVALVLFLLCLFLGKNSKSNTPICIVLVCFLTILVGHTIEMTQTADTDVILKLVKCVTVDEAFTFVSFLSFLWLDKIEIEEEKKQKSGNGKIKIEDKTIEDGLDLFWKKV